jgi:hypothetical protein
MIDISQEVYGVLFLLLLCIAVGVSALIVVGALVDAMCNRLSPTGFVATVVAVCAITYGVLRVLGVSSAMVFFSLEVCFAAMALLVLPIPRRCVNRVVCGRLTSLRRVVVGCSFVAGVVGAYVSQADWFILRVIGMTDAWSEAPQGLILARFVDVCAGCLSAVVVTLMMRIRDEWKQSGHV